MINKGRKNKPDCHFETIKCPNCKHIQKASVLHTWPFYSYVTNCEKCDYIIMESEWVKVKT